MALIMAYGTMDGGLELCTFPNVTNLMNPPSASARRFPTIQTITASRWTACHLLDDLRHRIRPNDPDDFKPPVESENRES